MDLGVVGTGVLMIPVIFSLFLVWLCTSLAPATPIAKSPSAPRATRMRFRVLFFLPWPILEVAWFLDTRLDERLDFR